MLFGVSFLHGWRQIPLMLNSLDYSIIFPNGKAFEASINFKTGLTAITGENETGKSLTLEMIRAAYWGQRAFRGQATDYRKLKLDHVWTIKGTQYRVKRTGSKAELFEGDTPIASGVKPVNQRIEAIFGYGMDVFDVSNACLQGEIERLGAMRPTERKALVDKTIGLDAVEEAITWASQQASDLAAEVRGMQQGFVEPISPTKPPRYRPSAEIEVEVGVERAKETEITRLQMWLSGHPALPAPVEPATIDDDRSVDDLEIAVALFRTAYDRSLVLRSSIASIRTPELTQQGITIARKEIEDHDAWVLDERMRSNYPAPACDGATLGEISIAAHNAVINASILRIESHDSTTCPSCQHTWTGQEERLQELRDSLEVVDLTVLPAGWEKIDVRQEAIRQSQHDQMLSNLTGAIEVDPPVYVASELNRMETEWAGVEKLEALTAELAGLDATLSYDPTNDRNLACAYHLLTQAYTTDLFRYQQREDERAHHTALLTKATRAHNPEKLATLTKALPQSVQFETEKRAFDKANEAYCLQGMAIAAKEEYAQQWSLSKVALRDLKARIKNYLLPSLNTVASILLSQMTGGSRSKIEIDDDFEIFVDGDRLSTLSGSGKAVSNLAIRLGLGQVLTNRTFSVLLADEIDASMDSDRAGFTADCLSNLTGSIGQILLVSHKDLCASHHIKIGNNHEPISERTGDGEG
jgi:exonuclease SbcC